ncbi:MAG: UDP-2-acetamido-3-amino-2,3-dideoxy-D-glucuronate N-acetyltransferase [Chlamydiae bacterium]|nr:UDP-2-acetamido-3-amino-2,3-dideoxy-D-glucuronate N-acetyltransferase [Chlamydiota bacterium]
MFKSQEKKGLNYFVHESTYIDEGVQIGENTEIWHFCHLLPGVCIGENCKIGQNVMIDAGVIVGSRCKIQNNVSVYKGVVLEDGVFCGPSCVFTNVTNPRAEVERKDEIKTTLVKKGATVGANATIICGVSLGEYCLVGAGSVVTKDVRPHALVIGSPAKQIGWVSHAGEILGSDLVCKRQNIEYQILNGKLSVK